MNQLVTIADDRVLALVAAAGERAAYRFLEFFTAQIRNPIPSAPMRGPWARS